MINTEQTNFASEWEKGAAKRAFRNRFPRYDESFSRAIVKEYNNVDAPAAFVKCKDAIYTIIGDERSKALNSPSFDSADHYLSTIKDSVDIIAKELGEESVHYKNISNEIIQTCISLLIETVWAEQTVSTVKEAKRRAELLNSYYPISESTQERISRTILEFEKIEEEYYKEIKRAQKERQEQEKASRLSERMKRFALKYSSIPSGGKRYTSPGWAVLVLIVLGFASIISLFESIASIFKREHEV